MEDEEEDSPQKSTSMVILREDENETIEGNKHILSFGS